MSTDGRVSGSSSSDDTGTVPAQFDDAVAFSGKARIGKAAQVALNLSNVQLYWCAFASKATEGFILNEDIFGVTVSGDPREESASAAATSPPNFTVHFMIRKKNEPSKRIQKSQVFYMLKYEEAVEWRDAILSVIDGEKVGVTPRQRRLLILINPVGGTKIAVPTFEKRIRPILELSPVQFDMQLTAHYGHAVEIAKDLPLGSYDGIVTVSGDGLLHEVINGLMKRNDWSEAIKTPIGIIPCGSGNGLAKSLEIRDYNAAVLNIIKGHVQPLDLHAAFQPGASVRYMHLGMFWGILADVDIESEKYRWAGPIRFEAAFVGRLINLRKYRGRLCYLPISSSSSEKNEATSATTTTATTSTDETASEPDISPERTRSESQYYKPENGPACQYLCKDTEAGIPGPGADWKMIEGEFIGILGLNIGWVDQTTLLAPFATHEDGSIDLVYIPAPCSRSRLLSIFMDIESGKHVHSDLIKYVKCKAYTLEPVGGIVDLDGEQVATAPISVECHKGLGRIICPSDHSAPLFKNYDEFYRNKQFN